MHSYFNLQMCLDSMWQGSSEFIPHEVGKCIRVDCVAVVHVFNWRLIRKSGNQFGTRRKNSGSFCRIPSLGFNVSILSFLLAIKMLDMVTSGKSL